jgi:enoyl-CoA hydratase/carnithine racemase
MSHAIVRPHNLSPKANKTKAFTVSVSMRYTPHLLPSRQGNLGILTLNNPQAFHALNLDMIRSMHDVLQQWYKDDSLEAILVNASTDGLKKPVFCAGGDVKSVYYNGKEEATTIKTDEADSSSSSSPFIHGQGYAGLVTADFFRHEYHVNHMLATATKPLVSFWDGIVMGGGVGISIYSKYRVATEHSVLAMPETSIGLFPDVGSMYWMPRLLPSMSVAMHMGLTGVRLLPSDLLWAGLATHYVPSGKLQDLQYALADATKRRESIAPVLMSFHEMPPVDPIDSDLAKNKREIDLAFGDINASLLDIMHTLHTMDTAFAQETLQTLQKMSPTSMKVTLEGLRRGAKMSDIGQDLIMEYRMSQAFMREGSDFYEGIRATLIDKDRQPKWNPASVEQVTDEMVESYFAPLEHEWVPETTSRSEAKL